MIPKPALTVTPAKAGAQSLIGQRVPLWVPAFAGMTRDGRKPPTTGRSQQRAASLKAAILFAAGEIGAVCRPVLL
jgi:hypothetical protein